MARPPGALGHGPAGGPADGDARLRLRAAGAGTWEVDARTGRSTWSPELCALMGLPPGGHPRTPEAVLGLVHPDDRDAVAAARGRVLAGEDVVQQFRARRADGRWRWIRDHAGLVRDAAGRPRRVLGLSFDVTDLAEAEAALRESESRFRALADVAPVMIWVADAGGALTYLNRGWLEFTGRAEPDELGAGWAAGVHPDDVARCLGTYRAAVAGRRAFEMVHRLRRHDGAHRWVLNRGAPRLGPDGACVGFVGACLDVTERHEAGEEADQARALLALAIDRAPLGFALLDREGRAQRVNAALAALGGAAPGGLAGREAPEVVPGLAGAARGDPVARVLRTGVAETDVLLSGPVRGGGEGHWLAGFYPVPGPAGGVGVVVADVTDRIAAERRLALLSRASVALDAAIGVDERLRRLARLAVPVLGDACTVDLLHDGAMRRAAVAHADPDLEDALRELPPLSPAGVAGDALADGLPRTARAAGDAWDPGREGPEAAAARLRLGLGALLVAPLRARGRRLGVIAVGRRRGGFGPGDLELAQELGRRAALALDNAALFEAEQRARDRADRLQRATAALAQALTPEEITEAVLGEGLRALGASAGGLVVWADEGVRLRTAATIGYPPGFTDPWRTMPIDARLPVTDAVRTGRLVLCRSREELVRRYPELAAVARSERAAAVPLVAGGRVLGALTLGAPVPGDFAPEDHEFMLSLGRLCAQALERGRLYAAQRHIARTLQRALLPPELPAIAGLRAAARYAAGGEGTEVGGDFYDLFELPAGGVAAVVGDVCGRGAEAAAVTALSRYTLRAVLPDAPGPAAALARLNRELLRQRGDGRFVTALVVALERSGAGWVVRAACAGHHPALVLRAAGGPPEPLGAWGTLLGILPVLRLPEAAGRIGPGDLVVCFTDGLIEARAPAGEPFGEGRLRALLEGCRGQDVEAVAGTLMQAAAAHAAGEMADDVAVLVLGGG